MRNYIKIVTLLDGELVSHFSLNEFETGDGFVMIHSSIPHALESIRRDLNAIDLDGGEVQIVITGSTRTQAENEELARRLGYTDQGGAVARHSYHLPQFKGVAVDFYARHKESLKRVPQKVVGDVARRYFDFVKDDYGDGHIHADNRRLTQ
jgi:hypothetical protein